MGELGEALRKLLEQAISGGVLKDDPFFQEPEVCAVCGGIGFVYPAVPEHHPDYGQRRMCSCQNAAMAERIRRHWLRCGWKQRHLNCRLETHPLHLEGVAPRLIAELGKPTDANDTPGWQRSWYLWGDAGHGKSGLAAGHSYRRLMATWESVCVRAVPDLLDELKASYNPRRCDDEESETEAQLLARYTNAGLLVLDDLGTEYLKKRDDGSSWAVERLFTIINHRHSRMAPVFLTSNLPLEDVAAYMGSTMGARFIGRVTEACAGSDHMVKVHHRDLRLPG